MIFTLSKYLIIVNSNDNFVVYFYKVLKLQQLTIAFAISQTQKQKMSACLSLTQIHSAARVVCSYKPQNSSGEVGPACVGSSFPERCFHGDRLAGEHDAAHPLPEE